MKSNMKGRKAAFLGATCLFVLAAGSVAPAFAQDGGATGAVGAQPGAEQSDAAASDDASNDDVVISARRREERVQEVPVSVTSISAESLASRGITSPTQLAQVTPGVSIVASGAYSQPVIRGISSTSVLVGDEANVAIYVDGVYMSQMSSNFFKFNNIERVEVLKGPQGTLFGRNATGGAITIITKAPSFTPTGNVSIGYGSYDRKQAAAYFSTGLSNTIAFDVAAVYDRDRGYVRDLIRGGHVGFSDFKAVRGKLLFQPSDRVNITLAGDWSYSNNVTTVSSQALNGNTRARTINPAAQLPTGLYQYLLTRAPEDIVQSWGANLRAEFDLGAINVTSITSYRNEINRSVTDTDGSFLDLAGADVRAPSSTWTHELQLSSSAESKLQWVVGGYGFWNLVGYDRIISFPSLAATRAFINTNALAAFGEATFPFTDQLSVTAGIRYSFERKVNYGQPSAGGSRRFRESWDGWTPRVIVKYEVPETLNIYGSFSKGFKSGQFNSSALSGAAVAPEKIEAYEVGVKTLFSGPWRASLALYHYDYDDIQISSRLPGATLAQLNNAARARIRGVEFNAAGQLSRDFSVNIGASVIDAKYTDFRNANVTIPSTVTNPTPATACVMGTGALIGGNRALICDVTGAQMIRTPDWTVTLAANYTTDMADGRLDASANLYISDKFYWDALNRIAQPSYAVLNARLGWTLPNKQTRIGVYGDNLTNESYQLVVSTSNNGDWVNYAKPRSFGVELSHRF